MSNDLQQSTVSRDYLDNIIRSMTNALIVTDAEGMIKIFNLAAMDILGYREEELVGQPLGKIFAEESPFTESGSEDVIKNVIKKGVVSNVEKTYLTKDGDKIPVSFSSSVMRDGNDRIQGIVCVAQDITERKQMEEVLKVSEEYFRSFIESSQDCVCHISLDGKLMSMNQAGCALSEIDKPEEVIGKSCTTNILENREAVEEAISQSAKGKNVSVQYKAVSKKGREIWWDSKLTPVGDVDGTIKSILKVSRDITERKRMEEALAQQAKELARSNAELGQFAYVASHDLQEPLRKVMAFGDRLKTKYNEVLGEQGRNYLERMQNATERMQDLIKGLLKFSRVTTKAQPFVPVDLATVAHEVLSDLEVRIEQLKGRVEVGDLPTIDADSLQMRQLFQNLIGNALKFHRKDEAPVVNISSQLVNGQHGSLDGNSPAHDLYQVTIKDNGIGFDEKYVDRIFGVFQRLHGRTEYEGTGIGLAICRKIVERHDGSITAKSIQGKGTKFIVTLPVRQPK